MSFLPLDLGIGLRPGAEASPQKPASKSDAEKVLRRDDDTCRFCGFQAKRFQRVVPYLTGGKDLPYVTACTFCEQCLSLERAGMMATGILIWLPDIGQAELNHIVRAAYVAREEKNDDEIVGAANKAIEALTARRTDAKKRLGSDEPLLLATALHENLTPEEQAAAGKKLQGIRLLVQDRYQVRTSKGDINNFPALVAYWRSPEGPFGQLPAAKWKEMFKEAGA